MKIFTNLNPIEKKSLKNAFSSFIFIVPFSYHTIYSFIHPSIDMSYYLLLSITVFKLVMIFLILYFVFSELKIYFNNRTFVHEVNDYLYNSNRPY